MTISRKEQDNLLRWDGEKLGHYEVYYLKWNDMASQTAYWIRYTMTAPLAQISNPYCELWGIFFDAKDPKNNFAVKNRFQIDKLAWNKDKFRVQVSDAELTMNACHGKIVDEAKGNTLSWELDFDSPGNTFYHFPNQRFYTGSFPKTKALAPHEDARFTGTVIANGREIKFSEARGQQTHLWGVKHALRWAWGHCNTFKEDEDVIWEGLDSQIMLGPVKSPHFKLFYLRYKGRDYYFNRLPQWFANKSKWELARWTFDVHNKDIRMVGELNAPYEDFVAVTYTDPDGDLLWCNNCKVSDIKLTLFDASGARIDELTSDKGSAAEYVDRKTYPEVPVRI